MSESVSGTDKNNTKKIRGKKANEKQQKMLVEYVKSKPQLYLQSYTYKEAQKNWENISTILNSMPGAIKNWMGWRKVR